MPESKWTPARIKFFKPLEGWGFAYREGGKDIFIHKKLLTKIGFTQNLPKEAPVELLFEETTKGLCATDLRIPAP